MPILHGSGIYLLKLAAMQWQLPCLLGYKKPYFQINLYSSNLREFIRQSIYEFLMKEKLLVNSTELRKVPSRPSNAIFMVQVFIIFTNFLNHILLNNNNDDDHNNNGNEMFNVPVLTRKHLLNSHPGKKKKSNLKPEQ